MAVIRSMPRWLLMVLVSATTGVLAQAPQAGVGPLAAAGPSTLKPVLTTGDTWIYRTIDRWKDEEIKSESYTVVERRPWGYVVELKHGVSTEPKRRRWSQELNAFASPKHETDVGWLRFPLTAEPSWESIGPWAGGSGRTELQRRVVGNERIATRAGTFDTIRIEGSGRWFRSERNSGVVSETIWYASLVKRYVRRDTEVREASFAVGSFSRLVTQTREELIEYSLQP